MPTLYQADLPNSPEAIVFVNGLIARNRAGFFWMWKNLNTFRSTTAQAEGCCQVKSGICGPNEIVMVSYWRSQDDLMQFFRGQAHREMMQFTTKHPRSLCLYNEIYRPNQPGKYLHEPQGMATVYGQSVR